MQPIAECDTEFDDELGVDLEALLVVGVLAVGVVLLFIFVD
jgi:hypothetical protein